LRCEHELRVVPNATHLFEEPGTLEEVARLAAEWFATHFSERKPPDDGSTRNHRVPHEDR